MSDYTTSWMDFAQRPYDQGGLGLAKHQAAGIVGNLQNESGPGIDPWGVTGDNGTAQGSAQWRGDRLASLQAMFPDSYQTPEAQQAFMRHELDTSYGPAYEAIKAATSPEEAARAFNKKYEISADNTDHRATSAREVFGSDLLPDAGSPPGTGYLHFAQKGPGVPALSPDNTMGPGALSPYAPQPQDPWDRRAEGLSQIGASIAGIVNPAQAASINSQIASDHTDENTKNQQKLMANIYAQRMTKDAQGSWTSHVLPNGQVLQTNTTGQTRMLPGTYGKDATTTDQAPQMTPVWGDPTSLGTDPTARTPEQEQAYLGSMKPAQSAMVQGILDNTLPPPTANAMTRKDSPWPAAFAAAKTLDPTLDPTTYSGRVKGQQDWASKGAESARALNQTIAHQSGVLVDAMKNLNNGDTPLFNSAKNMWSENIGGHDSVPVFRTAAHAVVDELGKVFKQNNLSDTEIRKWEENLPANMSPEQQRGQIAAFSKLMEGAMSALEDKRKQQIGPHAAAKGMPLLSPDGVAGIQALKEFAKAPAGPRATAPAAPRRSLDDIFK